MPREQRTIFFSGNVQGVGFRITAVHQARGLDLAGSVRNLDDGRVELIAEGEPPAIDALIRRLREHFGHLIRTVEQTTNPPQNLEPGIHVTY